MRALGMGPRPPWRMAASDALAIVNTYQRAVLSALAPPGQVRKRQHWISESTMEVIRTRASQRRARDRKAAEMAKSDMATAFHLWLGAVNGMRVNPRAQDHAQCARRTAVEVAILDQAAWRASGLVRRAAREDKKLFIEAMARKAQKAYEDGDSRAATATSASSGNTHHE